MTHSKRMQTITLTVLDAGKGFTILGSATKTSQISLCKKAEGSSISAVPVQTVSSPP